MLLYSLHPLLSSIHLLVYLLIYFLPATISTVYQLFPNVLVFVSALPLISLPHFHVLIHPSPLSVSLSALGVLKVPPVELQAAIVAALTASLSGREEVLTSPHLLFLLHHQHHPLSPPPPLTHIHTSPCSLQTNLWV